MALDRVEVRIMIPADLDVVLQRLAKKAGDTKVGVAKDIICSELQQHLDFYRDLHSGLSDLGLQSEVMDRRVPSDRQ